MVKSNIHRYCSKWLFFISLFLFSNVIYAFQLFITSPDSTLHVLNDFDDDMRVSDLIREISHKLGIEEQYFFCMANTKCFCNMYRHNLRMRDLGITKDNMITVHLTSKYFRRKI